MVIIEKKRVKVDDASVQEQQRVLQILLQACSVKTASQLAAAITGGSRNVLYDMAMVLKGKEQS